MKELLKLLAMNLHVQNYCNDASLVILVSALNRTADALPDTPTVPKSEYDELRVLAEGMAEMLGLYSPQSKALAAFRAKFPAKEEAP